MWWVESVVSLKSSFFGCFNPGRWSGGITLITLHLFIPISALYFPSTLHVCVCMTDYCPDLRRGAQQTDQENQPGDQYILHHRLLKRMDVTFFSPPTNTDDIKPPDQCWRILCKLHWKIWSKLRESRWLVSTPLWVYVPSSGKTAEENNGRLPVVFSL